MTTPTFRLILVLLIVALTAACGATAQTDSADPAGAEASPGAVEVVNIAYKPAALTVASGTAVTWTSGDEGVVHTVTSGRPGKDAVPGLSQASPPDADGRFDGDLPDAGTTFSHTFTEAGTYPYFCEVHPSMTAEVVVR